VTKIYFADVSEIGHRCWMGKQGAAAVAAAEECTNNEDHEQLIPAPQDTKGVLDGGAWPYLDELFWIGAPWYSFIPLNI